ncbi:D-alanyl-D-alanine carboxypeptidase/D-alanyl-D-alanine-endopeptidase [gut metagenome]|uniref:D-alanyl-D-alanine carboxypeptidase/D-alanyl-D-alanine-endopeptidase n=1 Tax=gut metagenome TaxID=749906 RepID=J9H748_9ZZZZ
MSPFFRKMMKDYLLKTISCTALLACAFPVFAGWHPVPTPLVPKVVQIESSQTDAALAETMASPRTLTAELRKQPQMSRDPYCRVIAQHLDSLMGDPLLQEGQLGLCVYDLTDGSLVFEHGMWQRMRPASTMKIVTAVTALSLLGANYEYATGLYLKGRQEGDRWLGDVCVHGGFDPLFDQAGVKAFVGALYSRGIRRIEGNIVLDLSLKDDKRLGWGWCWDDDDPVLSPLLCNGKDNFSLRLTNQLRLKQITFKGEVVQGRIPEGAEQIECSITPLESVLQPMMKNSDNLMAESMFYQIGAQSKMAYADRNQAVRYIRRMVKDQLQLDPDAYQFADGSGLSQYNYVTPQLLVSCLEYAYRNEKIFPAFYASLPIAGIDGTLKNRMRKTSAFNNVRAKTGTVTGICSLAGYVTTGHGHLLAFAIINQGQKYSAKARNFQDKVCTLLAE